MSGGGAESGLLRNTKDAAAAGQGVAGVGEAGMLQGGAGGALYHAAVELVDPLILPA